MGIENPTEQMGWLGQTETEGTSTDKSDPRVRVPAVASVPRNANFLDNATDSWERDVRNRGATMFAARIRVSSNSAPDR